MRTFLFVTLIPAWIPVVCGDVLPASVFLTESKFESRFVDEMCELLNECPEFAGIMDSCEDLFTESEIVPDGCSFNREAARECLDAVDSLDCDALILGLGLEECTEVTSC